MDKQTRYKLEHEIGLTLQAEYCVDLDGCLEMLLGRFTDDKISDLHADLSKWFGISWSCPECWQTVGASDTECFRSNCRGVRT